MNQSCEVLPIVQEKSVYGSPVPKKRINQNWVNDLDLQLSEKMNRTRNSLHISKTDNYETLIRNSRKNTFLAELKNKIKEISFEKYYQTHKNAIESPQPNQIVTTQPKNSILSSSCQNILKLKQIRVKKKRIEIENK